jgi:hypothetical protein
MPKKEKKDKKEKKEKNESTESIESKEEPTTVRQIPEEFSKIINDFTEDICNTFPEYRTIVGRWWTNSSDAAIRDKEIERVFSHCLRVFPERFFDILYQNASIFEETSDINTEFLPGVVFKYLWSCTDITEKTRETIWKYLQLLLVSVVGSVKDGSDFGDTAKLFEAINETELKTKLEETLQHMQSMFSEPISKEEGGEGVEGGGEGVEGGGEGQGINMENLPSAENIQDHINKMMQGKLGKLAMEIAEEATEDMDLNMDGVSSADDVFKKMFKNPGKLMGIVKNLGTKLDAKIKSGEIKESELISEGMEMLDKMKSMPGMGNMYDMLNKMGVPLPKNGKVNVNAMDAQMQKNLKMAQMKERMRKKAEESRSPAVTVAATAASMAVPKTSSENTLSDEQLFAVFRKEDKNEKTPRVVKKKK